MGNAFFGALLAGRAFIGERLRHNTDGENAFFLRDLRDNRSGARTGAAAHAGCNKEQMSAGHGVTDFFSRINGGFLANLRIRPGAEPAFAELQKHVSLIHGKSLMIGVGRDKLNTVSPLIHHILDGISTAATHADHFDHRVARILTQHFKTTHCPSP